MQKRLLTISIEEHPRTYSYVLKIAALLLCVLTSTASIADDSEKTADHVDTPWVTIRQVSTFLEYVVCRPDTDN